jgi:hypothetical protein
MQATGSSTVLWDYCMERRALIFQVTAKKLFQLNRTNPHTATFGAEADISHICNFGWYEWVYYRTQSAQYPFQKECLGRCLGPARNEGNVMAQWILKENGKVVPRRTLCCLTLNELAPSNKVEIDKRSNFTSLICANLGDLISLPQAPLLAVHEDLWDLEPYYDEEEAPLDIPDADFVDTTGKPLLQQSFTDTLINAEVLLQADDSAAIAKVMQRCVDDEGRVVGDYNENLLLNTIMYECEFGDGTTKAVNTIVTNIYMESNADGHSSLLLYHIVDKDKYFVTATGTKRIRQTTKGWKLLVQWHDGSRQWIDLKILKESNPIQVAEYATACDIAEHPAFTWWVPYVLRKRNVTVSAVNSRVCKCSHKYEIEVPCSIKEALDFDRRNGNTFWADALTKEMGNVCVAFEILGPNDKPPVGWYKASSHIVFDVKMDFTRKTRWVKDGHKTPDSTTPSFAGVVSWESICVT